MQRDFISNRGFTLKAIMTGVIGGIIICAIESYNAYYVGGTHLVGNHFPIAAVFLFLIIILAHAGLKSIKPGYGYTTAELGDSADSVLSSWELCWAKA